MVQIGRGDGSSATNGNWSAGGGASSVSGAVSDINNTTLASLQGSPGSSEFTVGINDLTDPSTTNNHTIYISGSISTVGSKDFVLSLFEGSTRKASGTVSVTATSATEYSTTLSSFTISDYTNLKLGVESDYDFLNMISPRVHELWIEIPDAGGGGGGGGTTADSVKLGNAGFTFRGLTNIGG